MQRRSSSSDVQFLNRSSTRRTERRSSSLRWVFIMQKQSAHCIENAQSGRWMIHWMTEWSGKILQGHICRLGNSRIAGDGGLRARPGLRPAGVGETALQTSLEIEREFAQSRCDPVVSTIAGRVPSVAAANGSRYCSFAFFGNHPLHFRENLIRRQYPIHRNWVATLRRTTNPQRPVAACSARYLDLPASNDFATDQAETFLVEWTPLPKLIEPAQRIQFICVRQCNWRR